MKRNLFKESSDGLDGPVLVVAGVVSLLGFLHMLDAVQIFSTMIFVVVGTLYAMRNKRCGALAVAGITAYVASWLLIATLSPLAVAALSAVGIGLWFLGFFGSFFARPST